MKPAPRNNNAQHVSTLAGRSVAGYRVADPGGVGWHTGEHSGHVTRTRAAGERRHARLHPFASQLAHERAAAVTLQDRQKSA